MPDASTAFDPSPFSRLFRLLLALSDKYRDIRRKTGHRPGRHRREEDGLRTISAVPLLFALAGAADVTVGSQGMPSSDPWCGS